MQGVVAYLRAGHNLPQGAWHASDVRTAHMYITVPTIVLI